MKPTTLPIGTISHGTMRLEDLIPKYVYVLGNLHLSKDERKTLNQIKHAINKESNYYESDDANYDMEDIENIMNNHVPTMCYFGSTEGDGSDYGVWPILDSDDVPVVKDPSELKDIDSLEAYFVNDNENVLFYAKHGNF